MSNDTYHHPSLLHIYCHSAMPSHAHTAPLQWSNHTNQHNDALHAFHTWRRSSEAQLLGIGGPHFESTCPFVPRSNLEKYFERPRQLEHLLDASLDSTKRPTVDADYVRRNYLQSFATLLCIGEGGLIHHFSQYESLKDQKLPYRTRPDDFPYTTPDKFEDFKNAQWQFCASNLEYGMNGRFKEEDILPIILKEKIGEGGSAIIYKIVVDENYNALQPRGHVIPVCSAPRRETLQVSWIGAESSPPAQEHVCPEDLPKCRGWR